MLIVIKIVCPWSSFSVSGAAYFNLIPLSPPAKEVWGKVIFSEAFVSHYSVHKGGGLHPGGGSASKWGGGGWSASKCWGVVCIQVGRGGVGQIP